MGLKWIRGGIFVMWCVGDKIGIGGISINDVVILWLLWCVLIIVVSYFL